ncbi:ABC transporter permease [Olsenella profusa]|uniref:ABC transporter permease n=1 Tax=Olsenella profusa TaxID=138595 RepID=A0ABS2F2J3_9ACTN|nr:ABC transporter permease [Olsenella profusa]MBM6774768.1 ABC transporter permease [Olsenella profusa]
MAKYALKRLVTMIVMLFIVASATFFMLAAVPGDALTERTARLPEDVAARVYARYGLDKPVMERYAITMKGLVVGDFGESIVFPGQTVQSVIAEKGPISLRLGVQQVVLGVGVGLVLGVLATIRKNTWVDYTVIAFSILMVSVPTLVFGLLLQQVFAGELGLFPVIGWPTGSDLMFGGWEYTILPTLAGSFSYMAMYARLLKASMSDVLGQDYILAAEARGLSGGQIVRRHMIRNAAVPIVTKLPMTIAMCLTGSFYIETIFAIPGLGRYYIQAISGRDVTMVMGFTVIIAAMYMVVIFLTDILYHVVDPRIRLAGDQAR